MDWAVALRSGSQSASTGESYTTPEAFGAVGDGIADDTRPIQAALDSGKPVFMGGNYRTTATLILKTGTKVLAPCTINSTADVALHFLGYNISMSGKMNLICKNGIVVGRDGGCSNIFIDNVWIEFDDVFGVKIDADQGAVYNNSFRNIRCDFKHTTNQEAFENRTCYGFWLYKPNIEPYSFCNHNIFVDCGAGFCGIGAYLCTYDNQDKTHSKVPMNDNEFYAFSPEGCKTGVRLRGFVNSSNFVNMRTEDFVDAEIIQLYGFCAKNKFQFTNTAGYASIVGYDYMRDQASDIYDARLESVFANYFEGKLISNNAWGIHTFGKYIIASDKNGGAILVPQSPMFDEGEYDLDYFAEMELYPTGKSQFAFPHDTFSTYDDYTGESRILILTNLIWWPIRIIVKPGATPLIVKDADGEIVFRLKEAPTKKAIYTLHIKEYGKVEYITKENLAEDEMDLTDSETNYTVADVNDTTVEVRDQTFVQEA